ncbi:MAG: hypothetical protein BAA01_14600 [Bacillus thermozeamaize]|uniref:Uncharacterized protein n=1 Tax=Bacillus thermozeamaize TaxID=230954 RepID=A0A1Y3PU19_9BACI|nr:MAG: hypothetical protein BAA01_14600 [Bacillus thermozeamaize]
MKKVVSSCSAIWNTVPINDYKSFVLSVSMRYKDFAENDIFRRKLDCVLERFCQEEISFWQRNIYITISFRRDES